MSTEKFSTYDVLNTFFDEGSFQETDAFLKSGDGTAEAVTGFGSVDGIPVFAFVQNIDACGGAMSKAQAKKITKLYNAALKVGAPVVGFYDSVDPEKVREAQRRSSSDLCCTRQLSGHLGVGCRLCRLYHHG